MAQRKSKTRSFMPARKPSVQLDMRLEQQWLLCRIKPMPLSQTHNAIVQRGNASAGDVGRHGSEELFGAGCRWPGQTRRDQGCRHDDAPTCFASKVVPVQQMLHRRFMCGGPQKCWTFVSRCTILNEIEPMFDHTSFVM
jgi:hypothetical protein